jgi:uncharacterized OsmC-like protein
MTSEELKSIQTPIKEQYREHPQKALITLRSKAELGEGISCSIQTQRALVTAGLHPATGGSGLLACSGDMLLDALVACAGVTLKAVATALDIEIQSASVNAEGDLDFRGTLGVDKSAPVGFTAIRLDFNIQSSATEEQIKTLTKLTERYCVVYQTLKLGVDLNFNIHQQD